MFTECTLASEDAAMFLQYTYRSINFEHTNSGHEVIVQDLGCSIQTFYIGVNQALCKLNNERFPCMNPSLFVMILLNC